MSRRALLGAVRLFQFWPVRFPVPDMLPVLGFNRRPAAGAGDRAAGWSASHINLTDHREGSRAGAPAFEAPGVENMDAGG